MNETQIFRKGFVHSAYFWLKSGLTEDDIMDFESGIKKLILDSEFAVSGHIGRPAGTDSEIVNNSYDYSMIVTFQDSRGNFSFMNEEAHDRFRVITKKYCERVSVFDSTAV